MREDLYFAYADLIRSAKNDRHKLILYSHDDSNRAQLFDLVNDPNEIVNLIGTGVDVPEITARLFRTIVRYRDDWGDRGSSWGTAFWDRFETNGGLEAAVAGME